jgi:aquaporin Z
MPVTSDRFGRNGSTSSASNRAMNTESAWPEYLIEAALLALFMISACSFSVLLFHPASPLATLPLADIPHRALMGMAMGGTAIALIRSRWGQQSGAHLNPAVTLTFLSLGRLHRPHAIGYIVAQALGAIAGVGLAALLWGNAVANPAVNYANTLPGARGELIAFLSECAISFLLMLAVLIVSNRASIAHWTPWVAGTLVALFITFEAPLSGMSMNAARTLGSMLFAGGFTQFWIYLFAPAIGMLLAALVFAHVAVFYRSGCAKLLHDNDTRCIHCGKPAAIVRGSAA